MTNGESEADIQPVTDRINDIAAEFSARGYY
jgi:hypothetical protein